MGTARTGAMAILFGYVVAAELDQLALAEEVGTAVASIESDELVCLQGDTNNCRARIWRDTCA